MKAKNRPVRGRRVGGEGVLGLVLAVVIIALTIVHGLMLANSLVKAANLPVRNLTGGARSVQINGFDLWYREVGPADRNATVLVVIHGGPGMSDHYFGTLLDRLKNRYRVVYYDQRGSGFSQIRPNRSLYTFNALVDDLETLRRKVIRSDKMVLLGHSYGGLIAMAYAAAHPSHVAGLILVSSMPPRDYRRIDPAEPRFDIQLLREKPEDADRHLLRSYKTQVLESLYDPANGLLPDIGYMSYVPGRLLWDSSVGYNYTAGLEGLSVPALITFGASDTFLPVVPQMLHAALPDSTVVEFYHSGHWAFIEEPELFLATVTRFLNSLSKGAAAARK